MTADNAVFVLYLAKKYIVPSLAEKCIEFLEANLAAENVFIVLQQALQFDEKKLEKKCWDSIDLKTSEAVVSDAFTDINQTTLAEFLKRESLNVKEVDLFKAVMKWTEAECSRQEKSPTGKNKRAAMGNAMYQIRFSGLERTSEVWNLSERVPKEGILLRCCRFSDYGKRFFYQTDLVTCFVFSK